MIDITINEKLVMIMFVMMIPEMGGREKMMLQVAIIVLFFLLLYFSR